MASILNSLWGSSTPKEPEIDQEAANKEYLAEPEEMDPEAYAALGPLFENIQTKGEKLPKPVLRRVNFKNTKLERYDDLEAYAAVIDNAFSLKECKELLRMAEASSAEGWPRAQVNIGANLQVLDTSYRNSDRILYDNQELADRLLDRIRPLIAKDIAYLDPDDAGSGKGPLAHKGTAAKRRGDRFRLTRLNERLRFLKYPANGFFKMHCDGAYTTPDHKESSIFTFHLYLDDKTGDVPLKGGSTRFWEFGAHLTQVMTAATLKKKGLAPPAFYDVEPIPGRVLVFQHCNLVHSGEPITQGIKLTIRTDFMFERIPEHEHEIEYRKHLKRNGLLADEIPLDPNDDGKIESDIQLNQ